MNGTKNKPSINNVKLSLTVISSPLMIFVPSIHFTPSFTSPSFANAAKDPQQRLLIVSEEGRGMKRQYTHMYLKSHYKVENRAAKIGLGKNTLHFQIFGCGRHRILWEDVKPWSIIEEQCELRRCFTTLLDTYLWYLCAGAL
jgi:hypothetical protein